MNVKVKELTKNYGDVTAVDHINFDVRHGEILGFLGPNGAGKTTTLKIITTYLAPTSGKVFLDDIDVEEAPDLARRHIGYLPENNPLYPEMFVKDFLDYMAGLSDIPPAKRKGRIAEIIEVCGISDQVNKRIGELSKGYQQRVGLAQALLHDPDVLILDEPTTGLDPNQIVEIRELIKRIGREKTVLLSSHILAEVEATCDRIVIINKGKIIADGTAHELKLQLISGEKYKIRVANKTINEVEKLLLKLPSMVDYAVISSDQTYLMLTGEADSNFAEKIFRFAVDNGWVLTELSPYQAKLEDIFRQLTSEN